MVDLQRKDNIRTALKTTSKKKTKTTSRKKTLSPTSFSGKKGELLKN